MFLRNKKTGIIGELHFEPDKEYHFTVVTEDPADVMIYKKLAALYAEWEDMPEVPKAFGWRIDEHNEPEEIGFGFSLEELEYLKEIGLWFETKGEAEEAVEKLKAFKRLTDDGFRFCGKGDKEIDTIKFDYGECGYNRQDFSLLFGVKE